MKPKRFTGVLRMCRHVSMVILPGALVAWCAAAPLVWILRDGLGPEMVESSGAMSAYKFLVGWGVPAVVLTVPLLALWLVERRSP